MMLSVLEEMVDVKRGKTMANAVEASTSTGRVRQQQQEGTEPNKELSENERGRVQPTPEERTSDRDLGAPSPATVPTIPYQGTDTGGEILGRGELRRRASKGSRNDGRVADC